MERIEGIKIIQVDGLTGGGSSGGSNGGDGQNGNLADSVVSSALRYRAQAPLLDALLKEVGLTSGDLGRLTSEGLNSIGAIPASDAVAIKPAGSNTETPKFTNGQKATT